MTGRKKPGAHQKNKPQSMLCGFDFYSVFYCSLAVSRKCATTFM